MNIGWGGLTPCRLTSARLFVILFSGVYHPPDTALLGVGDKEGAIRSHGQPHRTVLRRTSVRNGLDTGKAVGEGFVITRCVTIFKGDKRNLITLLGQGGAVP